jgi:hypothetical protein
MSLFTLHKYLLGLVLLVLFVVTVSLGTIMAVDTDDILRSVFLLARQKDLEDLFVTLGGPALGTNGSAGDTGSHGVSPAVLVSHGSPGVVFGGRLGKPDVSAVCSDLARLEGFGNVLGDADGSSGGVDEPDSVLHVGEEHFVEETLGGGVKGTIDGNSVTERKHLLQRLDLSASNFLLDVGRHGLVVVVEELQGVEGCKSLQDSLPPEMICSWAATSFGPAPAWS